MLDMGTGRGVDNIDFSRCVGGTRVYVVYCVWGGVVLTKLS